MKRRLEKRGDVSHLNPAPIENKHRVIARDGHFYDATGRRVRFLGVNFMYALDALGKRAKKVSSRLNEGEVIFETGEEFQTVWYEIEA